MRNRTRNANGVQDGHFIKALRIAANPLETLILVQIKMHLNLFHTQSYINGIDDGCRLLTMINIWARRASNSAH